MKKAYEEAILHRCRVTGETVDLSQCGNQETESKKDRKEDDSGSDVKEKDPKPAPKEKDSASRRKESRDSRESESEDLHIKILKDFFDDAEPVKPRTKPGGRCKAPVTYGAFADSDSSEY